jgi:Trk K+ transport system NAD-binding subunit
MGERTFMSAVGPRGIIPASVATLFAVQLQGNGMDEAASLLVGVVFLVILLTVVFEGGFARHIAEALEVIPMRVIIVGGGTVGRALAERLEDRGENVVLVEADEQIVERTRNEGYAVHHGDGTDTEELAAAGAENARIVVAATGDDDANLLVSQLASSTFGIDRVIAKVNDPDNVDAFEELGVRTISVGMAAAWAIDNQIERPAIAHWMTDVGRKGDIQEVPVTNRDIVGETVREVGPMLPDACLIALLSKGDHDSADVPTADTVLERGDHVTLLGRRESVREGMKFVNPN